MQRNILSPVPKTHDDSVCAHSSSSPIYGLNLELFFEGDLSLLALHGKCLCQEFSNMWVHRVKRVTLVKLFTLHHQETIVLHNYQQRPPHRVFRKYCDQFTCGQCFATPMWEIGVSGILDQLQKLSFLPAFFPKKLKGTYLLWVWLYSSRKKLAYLPHILPSSNNEIMKWKPRRQCVQICLDREWQNQV